ncbi:MAG: putative heme d1 biosynthesis radical SAM protein NirJ1 [Bacillota bacterium]
MINMTKLLCGLEHYGDSLRYGEGVSKAKYGTTGSLGPVVVWNCTRTCNLKCRHCYMASDGKNYENELSTKEAKIFIKGLAAFKVPVLLLSGGEPLMRPDFFELVEYTIKCGIRVTVSTNGTVIDKNIARSLKKMGVSYVGISIDGIGEKNDLFRGKKGAFDAALQGIRNCLEVNQRVGLRFTITRYNYEDLEDIFRLIEEEKIPRACFYHLVYSGRGSKMIKEDVSRQESRLAVDLIMAKTVDFYQRGLEKEILTVDNHADGAYIYMRVKEKDPALADKIWSLLKINGGNRSGIAIGQVDNQGFVHADQFSQNHVFGNIREKSFADIWTSTDQPILNGLRNRKSLLKGRCANCKWLAICNGNFRPRAEAVYDDFWQSDPACYLTDQEIVPDSNSSR